MRENGNILPIASIATGAFLILVVMPMVMKRNSSAQMATVDAQVTIGDSGKIQPSTFEGPKYRWPDSEVPRTADRLQSVTAVAIATMSYVIERALARRPPNNAGEILTNIAQRNLIPNEWLSTRPGVLNMSNGTVHVRYSATSLSVEVISVPHNRLDGPAFLIRLPDAENISGDPRYFESLQLDGIVYAPPFAPLPDVINSGWQPRLFKQTQLPDVQRAQLEQWSRSNSKTP